MGLNRWLGDKESLRRGFDFWVRKTPWRKKWQPTAVFLPRKSRGQTSLVGYSPQGPKNWTALSDWITTNCGKFIKRWAYQTTLPASWEICMQVKKQQLELNMEQQIGCIWGKEYAKFVYCHHAYLTYVQSTSCEMPGWMRHKLESRLPGEISITSDTQMTPPLQQKVKKN